MTLVGLSTQMSFVTAVLLMPQTQISLMVIHTFISHSILVVGFLQTHFCINPFPNKPWFLPVCSTSFLKTLWEKEKLLMMSNFSFSHSVFYPFGELSAIFIKLKLPSGNSFSLAESKICRLGKG